MTKRTLTSADVAYIHTNYRTLDELCADRSEASAELVALIAQGLLPHPNRDPARFGRPPTRDLLVAAARARFPDVFDERAVHGEAA